MPQVHVAVCSQDHQDQSVTLLIGTKRYEFFLGDRYYKLADDCRNWLAQGWNNYVVARMAEAANHISPGDFTLPPWGDEGYSPEGRKRGRKSKRKEIDTVTDYKDKPSADYPFTVIAPTAKGLSYNGQRKWFKDQESATVFCGEVFESEKGQGSFELAIVKCVDVVRPKPTVQLMSSWNPTPSVQIEQKTESSSSG